jgi:hypothetical protein
VADHLRRITFDSKNNAADADMALVADNKWLVSGRLIAGPEAYQWNSKSIAHMLGSNKCNFALCKGTPVNTLNVPNGNGTDEPICMATGNRHAASPCPTLHRIYY